MKKKESNIKKTTTGDKNSKFLYLILLLNIIFWSGYPTGFSKANPVVAKEGFFRSMKIGLNPINITNIKLCTAEISIEVYDRLSSGHGEYHLKNLSNNTINSTLSFFIGDDDTWEPGNVYNIWINGTSTPFEFIEKAVKFHVFFDPLVEIELKINWKFRSSLEENYPYIVYREEWQSYFTGYYIIGGYSWNNNTIDYEKVVFNFQTDKFFLNDNLLVINYSAAPLDPNYYKEYGKLKQLVKTTNEVPIIVDAQGNKTFTYEKENILEDIMINIINDNSKIALTPFAYIGFIGLGIGVVIILKKKGKFLKK